MKSTLILVFAFVFTSYNTSSPVATIKNNTVFLNGSKILNFKKINIAQCSFYSLDGKEVLFYRSTDNFVTFHFIQENIKVQTTDATRFMAPRFQKSMEKLINWLLDDQVLNTDGSINPEKLNIFKQKYHEEIENKVITIKRDE